MEKITIGQKFFDRDYSYQALRSRLKAHQIAEYLKCIHEIDVPETFSEQLLTTHLESYRSSFNIPLRTIDAIVDACEPFEEYVLDINQLICDQVISMVKIHTCVISKNSLEKNLIPTKKDFPVNFQAVVRKNGSVTITASHS